MAFNEIETAIKQQGVIEIDYENQMGKRSLLHISCLEKKKDGNILAFCKESQSNLTLIAERIHILKWIWKNIYSQEDVTPRKGIYIFACRGDNHLVFECYQMEKGELLWKYFIGEYAHCDGWLDVEPLSYHVIDNYSESSLEWKTYINEEFINEKNIKQRDWPIQYKFELFIIKNDTDYFYAMISNHSLFCHPYLDFICDTEKMVNL